MSWRDSILAQFAPGVSRLTVVADPDALLTEEATVGALRERGFDLITFDDAVAFRFAYESAYRARWDRGETTELSVVLRTASPDLRALPYDLVQAGRQMALSLAALFPNLSYPVVATLDRAHLDALYAAQAKYRPGRLGGNATKDFILRHVFYVAPELIQQPEDLLRVLLRRHYQLQRVPPVVDQRFVELLHQGGQFDDWPLGRIVPDREAFFAFLQERWPVFVQRMASELDTGMRDHATAWRLEYPGPADIPFDHDDVRVYMDNLFADGVLQPVSHDRSTKLAQEWVGVGVHVDAAADRARRREPLVHSVQAALPQPGARYQDWLAFAPRWAELTALPSQEERVAARSDDQLQPLRQKVDSAFLSWAQARYGGLYNQPIPPPVMLHHIPRVMAAHLERAGGKAALVVVDGLAYDQWVVLRDVLMAQPRKLCLREGAAFAWVPTITPVSRQSLFAGRPPFHFPASLHTTNKEADLWARFWSDRGLARSEVAYLRGLGDLTDLDTIAEALADPRLRVAGLVVNKVDEIMHGMALGTAGMHNQVRQWANQGFMTGLLDFLLGRGFGVFLTSDHGNVEAIGCGSPAEGAVADLRAARVRVYSDEVLRAHIKARFPAAIEWPPLGLPHGYLPLLAPPRTAFVTAGERIVGHGGISVEEVIVPLVEIGIRDR